MQEAPCILKQCKNLTEDDGSSKRKQICMRRKIEEKDPKYFCRLKDLFVGGSRNNRTEKICDLRHPHRNLLEGERRSTLSEVDGCNRIAKL